MAPSPLFSALSEVHHALTTRSSSDSSPFYLNLVFKAYFLRTDGNYALAYFFLIVLGIVERLISLGIDCVRDKPGQPWRIFPRACLYFVVTMIRYVLMIAIMNVYLPIFFVICLGLTLGQIAVEGIRYYLMIRQLKNDQNSRGSGYRRSAAPTGFESIEDQESPGSLGTVYKLPPKTSHVSESCC